MGAKLFSMKENRLDLTEKGQALLQDALPLVESYEALLEKHDIPGSKKNHTVTLAVTYAYSLVLSDTFFDSLQAVHPDIAFDIEEIYSDGVLTMVQHDEAKIGILGSYSDLLTSFERIKISNRGIFIYVPSSSPLAEMTEIPLRELDGQAFVTAGKRDHLHRFFLEKCDEIGVHPHIILTTSDAALLAKTAWEKQAICFGFPETVVPIPSDCIVSRKLLIPEDDSFGTFAIRRRDTLCSGAAKTVWNAIECASVRLSHSPLSLNSSCI